MSDLQESWPSGATWVFQGTIAEDATAGTHVCTLTVSPGIGNEMQILYGRIGTGATATAQVVSWFIDEGTNIVCAPINGISGTTSALEYTLGMSGVTVTNGAGNTIGQSLQNSGILVSGTMRCVLRVSTAAISVTQTFGLVCRIRGMAKPTAVLNDTIGTSTNTVNTNQVF